eukprot:CAMPEP_0196769986 /NCGR_PEP_ID=MMETSP1104-20130614/859_1 /TAXON_ID=33652 /ORGANISM="Cafeteria sp., Strain Caron Lab Isolate" /LENGTH=113 /DNA_ID=CAMNT_0042140089 /DNA_START=1 /DNA_END=342 /DNA_ORIENTATION=+
MATNSAPPSATAPRVLSTKNLQDNGLTLNRIQSTMAIVSGCIAGILGLTNWAGFVCFGALHVVANLMVFALLGGDLAQHFPTTVRGFLTSGIGGQAASFILFWTLFYALVHLY